jgi:hypothetical protein
LLRQEANRLVTLREGDKFVRVTALQAAVRSLFYAAAKGNSSAQRMVLNAFQDIDRAERETHPPSITLDILQGLDLKRLSDEQLDQLDTILSCLTRPNDRDNPHG